jgi:aminoacylase
MDSSCDEQPEVKSFREYLRIKSVQPDPDYNSVVNFFEKIAKKFDLEFTCLEVVFCFLFQMF